MQNQDIDNLSGVALFVQLVQAALADGSLVEVLTDYAISHHPVHGCWLLWPSGPHLAPKVRALVDFLAKAELLSPIAHK